MGYSPLVSYKRLSPMHSGKRKHKIDTFSIHCMAGNLTVESCGEVFQKRQASSNYGIGSDGRIAVYVDEDNRSWCTSNSSNDDRAITIEVANTVAKHPWPVSDKAYAALIDLLVDCCKRHGIKKLLWRGDKSLIGQVGKQNMTVHRWFANKACPGDWLYQRHGEIAAEVNRRLAETDKRLEEDDVVRYKYLKDIPKAFRPTIEKLMNAKIIGGDGSDPKGNGDVIDLSHDMVRTLVFEYRGGAFDKKLIAEGLEPAVK